MRATSRERMVEVDIPISTVIHGHTVFLARPVTPPSCDFRGREQELDLCLAAWNVDKRTYQLGRSGKTLHFSLQGPPGVGKNEIVYQIARKLKMPLFIIHGHEDITPEDLALLMVPDIGLSGSSAVPIVLRASPLATALYLGGLVFFDEINRVPERALAPLASVLDSRQSIYSSIVGLAVEPRDEDARRGFRFCCALNPELSRAGRDLPDYVRERTLPLITVKQLDITSLLEIVALNVECSDLVIEAFADYYKASSKRELSIRQALAIVNFAANYHKARGGSESMAVEVAINLMSST
jgi:MoxR-like ATPase